MSGHPEFGFAEWPSTCRQTSSQFATANRAPSICIRGVAQLGRAPRSGSCAQSALFNFILYHIGAWLSLVERCLREAEVACSNHVAPIILYPIPNKYLTFFFYWQLYSFFFLFISLGSDHPAHRICNLLLLVLIFDLSIVF